MTDIYLEIENEDVTLPTKTKVDFLAATNSAVKEFENNDLIKKYESHTLTMADYHRILLTLFYQTYFSPSTFAEAGVNTDYKSHRIRDYLLKHAAEERNHWTWVIGDLRATGYKGPDPRELFPPISCQNYVAYQHYLALRFPLGRLGMAMVLEGIGGLFGTKYGRALMEALDLKPNQTQFFLQHGELDTGHTQEIMAVIEREKISGYEWAHLCHVAQMTGHLYKGMYDSSAT